VTTLERRLQLQRDLKGTRETRSFAANLELRNAVDNGGAPRLRGYASVFQTAYKVGRGAGSFSETINRGAFKRTLANNVDVVLLIDHGGLPLARTSSGTLSLSEDARGLRVDAQLEPSDPDVQSLVPKLKRGDLTEMSFGFRCVEDTWSEDRSKRLIRVADLNRGDVSIVTFGANPGTSVSVRARGGRSAPMPIRSYLEWSKLKRAQAMGQAHRGSRALADLVLSPFGEDWEIERARDVERAVLAVEVGHAKGKEAAVKQWIWERAEALDCTELVPASWKAAT
jgi:HK97 family phage prohead protease